MPGPVREDDRQNHGGRCVIAWCRTGGDQRPVEGIPRRGSPVDDVDHKPVVPPEKGIGMAFASQHNRKNITFDAQIFDPVPRDPVKYALGRHPIGQSLENYADAGIDPANAPWGTLGDREDKADETLMVA